VLTGSANASPIVAAWNYLLDLAGGDYVQLMWSTTNNNAVIFAEGPVAPHPGVPSSILTVTQQAGILAGTGITAINSLTGAVQTIGTGTTGTDFAVVSSGTSHTFNLPTASAANRGALSSADWSTFNGKQNSIGLTTVGNNLATLTNPNALTYLRVNADNTITARTPAQVLTDLGVSSNIILFRDFTIYTVANTNVNTLAWSGSVAANTLQVNDIIDFQTLVQGNTPNTVAFNVRLYVNTSSSLVGATVVGRFAVSNAACHGLFYRQIAVTATGASGNIRVFNNAATSVSAYSQTNATTTNITVNTTAPIFFILAFEMGNTTSTSTIQYINALISR
jgi:hypothetical protein